MAKLYDVTARLQRTHNRGRERFETEPSAHTQIINETADPFNKPRTALYISIRVDAKYIGILAEIADENTRPEAT